MYQNKKKENNNENQINRRKGLTGRDPYYR